MNGKQRAWFEEILKKHEYKRTGLFTQNAGRHEVVFLNRVVGWDPAAGQAGLEADVRHAGRLVQDWGRKDCEVIATPAVKKKANAE
eukprot:10145998-Heterocapsa_arctica.AAC.1